MQWDSYVFYGIFLLARDYFFFYVAGVGDFRSYIIVAEKKIRLYIAYSSRASYGLCIRANESTHNREDRNSDSFCWFS